MKPSVIVVALAVAIIHSGSGPSHRNAGMNGRIAEAYVRQPLAFEANRGQTDADVQFVSRGAGYTLFLTSNEAVLALRKAPSEGTKRTETTLRMRLVDSNPTPRVSQEGQLPGKSHYIIGNDRREWRTEVPHYARVRYQDIYPGVDLVYYGNQRQLEYDFIVAPGADPDAIELAFEGTQDIQVDNSGDLLLGTGDSEVRLKTPFIYQETDGRRVQIPGGYRKTGSNRVAFEVGSYDSTRPLVVDPILLYSTYLGGSNLDFAFGIATDDEGAVYITGYASSVDFPAAAARQPACAMNVVEGYCEDAFITKLSRYLTLEYSTYFGGSSGDTATDIALSVGGSEAYITGWTRSPDFPTVNAVDAVFGDDPSRERAFAAKLSSDGSDLLYSTYLRGEESSVHANSIAVDFEGAAYVTGLSRNYNGPSDVFVTKLTPDGSTLAYSLRFGSSGNDVGYGIAVDLQGYVSVTGATDASDFPQVGSPRPPSGGFAAKLIPDGSGFVYSTYLLGVGTGLAVAGPYTVVTGVMPGRDYGHFSRGGPGGGPTDAFVELLSFSGQGLNFTHLGGTLEDGASSIAIDWAGNVWVTGVTNSPEFPLVNSLQGSVRELDAFVVKLNAALEPVFSTYLGGSGLEQMLPDFANLPWPPGPALAVDHSGIASHDLGNGSPNVGFAYVAGFTNSTDFPTTGLVPAIQSTINGSVNGFVAVIVDDGIPTKPDLMVTEIGAALGGVPAEAEQGATLHYLFEVTNKGPARARSVAFFDKLPPGITVEHVLWQPSNLYLRNCTHDASVVSCTLGELSEGESVMVAIDITPTTVGEQINTAAVVDASSWPCPTCLSTAFHTWLHGFTQDLIWGEDADLDGDIHDNTVTTTTIITPGSADLSVTGSASSATVMLDDVVTYTLDVENHGPAMTAATLTDTLPAGATLVSATLVGSFGSCTGTSVITCHWPTLSGIARVTIAARAIAPGMLTNTAVVSGTAFDPNSGNNTVTIETRVNRPPTAKAGPDQMKSAGANCLAIVTLDGTASTDLDGDTLTYTWTADNLLPPPPPIVFSSADPSSGAVTGPTPSGPLPVGTHTITLTVDDGHGGRASDTVVVTIRDVTAPTLSGVPAPITIEQSSPSGAPLTLAMPTATDNCGGSVAVSSNAPSMFPPGATTVTFTAVDAAGNSATAVTTVTVVDTTPPTTTIVSPQARDYVHSDVLTFSFSATDGASGLAAGMPKATLDGTPVTNGQGISLLTLGLGMHSFVLTAADAAGNSVNPRVTISIMATLDSLIASVNVFQAQQKIDDSKTVNALLAKLNDAKQAAARGNNTAAKNKLQEFADLVRAQIGRHIAPDAAQVLITDAEYVMGTLQ